MTADTSRRSRRAHFLPLLGRQPVLAMAVIAIGLAQPVPDRLRGGLELPRSEVDLAQIASEQLQSALRRERLGDELDREIHP